MSVGGQLVRPSFGGSPAMHCSILPPLQRGGIYFILALALWIVLPACMLFLAYLTCPFACLPALARSFRRKVLFSPRGSYGRSQQEGRLFRPP